MVSWGLGLTIILPTARTNGCRTTRYIVGQSDLVNQLYLKLYILLYYQIQGPDHSASEILILNELRLCSDYLCVVKSNPLKTLSCIRSHPFVRSLIPNHFPTLCTNVVANLGKKIFLSKGFNNPESKIASIPWSKIRPLPYFQELQRCNQNPGSKKRHK